MGSGMAEMRSRRGLARWVKAILASHREGAAQAARIRALKRARPMGRLEARIYQMLLTGGMCLLVILFLGVR